MRRFIPVLIAGCVTTIVVVSSCAPPQPITSSGMSALPTKQMQWIRTKTGSADSETIRLLIEHLWSLDAGVRMAANARLETLTGRSFEYRYDDPSEERKKAIDRWTSWYQSSIDQ